MKINNVLKSKKKSYSIYQLIAKSFPDICGFWFDGCVVHHKDFNHFNNIVENLQILTIEEHIKIHHNGAKRSKKTCENISNSLMGRRNVCKHIPIIQYTKNGEFVKEWECITDVYKELGYSAGNICMCCQGKLKTAYKYLWRYKNNGDSIESPIL